ncbi:protein ORF100 [Cyprinid herpesvirus 3]|uniref:Protein ORF100 n=1 Tax=Cyprinid herpesvirus 3 TaxID=180230 RepID=A3QMR8_CYHV3|nr:unnamed protein product [Cyprinid herpesvirus 3]ABC55144.1 hypothetical protein [Cyprinid herpesvirus 3]ABG42927.1 protein ORF100 [Cyprinid herpesvirus 3]AJP55588.1 protein ORF100 [Cyprinid herpesvirus 3]AJP55743.1 protein ORF100 [Cyprinid herpesvirus 3]AVL27556.1 protein ORF100 [Cyprinid herpesvirus 3]
MTDDEIQAPSKTGTIRAIVDVEHGLWLDDAPWLPPRPKPIEHDPIFDADTGNVATAIEPESPDVSLNSNTPFDADEIPEEDRVVLQVLTQPVECWTAWKRMMVHQSLFVWIAVEHPIRLGEDVVDMDQLRDSPLASGVFRAFAEHRSAFAPVIRVGHSHVTYDVLEKLRRGERFDLRDYCDLAMRATNTITQAFRRFDKHDTQSRREAVAAAIWLLMQVLRGCARSGTVEGPHELVRLAHLLSLYSPSCPLEHDAAKILEEDYWPSRKHHRGNMGFRLSSLACVLYLQFQSYWDLALVPPPARLFAPDYENVTPNVARIKHSFDARVWELVDAAYGGGGEGDSKDLSGLMDCPVCPLDLVKYICSPTKSPIYHHVKHRTLL